MEQLSSLQNILSETEERVKQVQTGREGIARTETRLHTLETEIEKKMELLLQITRQDLKDNPAPKKDEISMADRETVITLHRNGWSNEEIARRMKRSIGEIDLLIEGNGFLN